MKSPKELRIDQARAARIQAINRLMKSNAEMIADLQSQIKAYKIAAFVFAIILGSAAFQHYF